jgi:CPA2 family monovalent cation:H+ antiporter-2
MEASSVNHFDMLTDLAAILCVAALTTVIFQRIKQPVVLGYLVAGLIVGPHVRFPLFADEAAAHQMAELGVELLMFSLGLEFSLRALIRVGPSAGVAAGIQCSLMIWLGYLTGRLFGWTRLESLFTGALIAISSTTIIVKAFAEQGIKGKLNEIVFGILVVEDLIAILLLALLTPLASGTALSAGQVALAIGKLAVFLIATLALGIFLVPRLLRAVVRTGSTETIVVTSVGLSFAFALLARKLGYSVALGAFLGGAIAAESGVADKIARAIEPVRDVFAAVFFVSVGMLIDPALVARHWVAVLVLTGVVVVGKVVGVGIGAFLAGHPVRTSMQAGMSLAQIGEFSFIIAGVGLSLGAVGDFLYPVAVAVSALTTLITPFLIKYSGPLASFLDRRLPQPLQTYASLYGSWVAAIREAPRPRTLGARLRRLVGLLALDAVLVTTIVIAASLNTDRLIAFASARSGVDAELARAAIVGGATLLASPFIVGAVRVARALGNVLATQALPGSDGQLDLAAAPRRALLVTLQLCLLLAAGIPVVAATQPFLPSVPGAAVLLLGVAAMAIPFWRSATNLHGHARAGAQVILEALARQTHAPGPGHAHGAGNGHGAGAAPAAAEPDVGHLFPGLGASTAHVPAGGPSAGRTLAELDLRGQTGASVIAIERAGQGIVYPGAREPLRAGDVLVLAGSDEAVEAARRLLSESGR